MTDRTTFAETLHRLRRPLALTHAGMVAERAARAFWPLWTVLSLTLALLMLGVQDTLAVEAVWGIGAVLGLGALAALIWGVLRFRWPAREEALLRLDASLTGRPLQTLRDTQAVGAGDMGSETLWQAHQRRMAKRAEGAKAVEPDLRVSSRDVFGLRFIALALLAVALLFGSFWRVGSVAGMAPGAGAALAAGPTWEGWVEPPLYTGMPVLYMADQNGTIAAPEGSKVTLRLYGEVGALTVDQTVGPAQEDPAAPSQSFTMEQDGQITITGHGGESWTVALKADAAPTVSVTGPAEASTRGEFKLPFAAQDDYGIEGGEAVITLNLDAVDRRYGLAIEPEAREDIRLPMVLPISGDRSNFTETIIEDLSEHPWANMPVKVTITAQDAAGQEGTSESYETTLSSRRFFDPLAAALIEQRRDLLWNRDNDRRIVQVLKAVSWKPEGLFRSDTVYLRLRVLMRRMDTVTRYASLNDEQVEEMSQALWDLALLIEDGDLDDARERLQRAQERLSEAMKNGASDEEIARLMQELRDATQDYMRQLSREAAEEGEQMGEELSAEQMENAMRLNQDDLQRMMDRIQELMEQGRMAEAEQALQELQQMMENMRVTQGQGGDQQSPGQQAMEGLSETLREQQGLSDQAFRDLQDRFNPNSQQGEGQQSQGQGGEQGQSQQPGQQQGQNQGNQQGEGQGSNPGQRNQAQNGQGDSNAQGGSDQQSLADRQQALRDELNRQRGNLPGMGGQAGDAARDALDRAERAMRGAEDALRNEDLAEAIDRQSEAMEALRDGLRNMGEAMAEEQRQQQGQQGQANGNAGGEQNDPLGRNAGTNGDMGNQRDMLQGEDVYRRALELEEELRRRSGDRQRPAIERDYLRRLLDRF
ncbi:TIGR02302 family protein [Pseudooceanicola sp. C21-150M6]|uniref:TIGR02302 family protein n=1 Tax=Pseudooceanicola sp. C21-150M6 TaxID=3434355 RepID=UPI003D7FF8F0